MEGEDGAAPDSGTAVAMETQRPARRARVAGQLWGVSLPSMLSKKKVFCCVF